MVASDRPPNLIREAQGLQLTGLPPIGQGKRIRSISAHLQPFPARVLMPDLRNSAGLADVDIKGNEIGNIYFK